ncbi:MAG: hypothetical protein M5R36_06750 [Deltaproteobacteria bacterium]|nr:hypothetical protein [Deltaproteobacteria bacterium]
MRAIVDEGRFTIDTYWEQYTHKVDYAYKDGHYFSDRPPGVAFLGVPFYAVGKMLSAAFGWNEEVVGKHFVLLVPVWFGAFTVLLLIRMMIRLGVSESSAWVAGLLYAFASMHWKFAAHLYNHVFDAFWFVALWYLAMDGLDFTQSRRREKLFCLLLASFPVISYPAGMFWGFFLLYVLVDPRSKIVPRNGGDLRALAKNAGFFLLPLLLVGFYHTVCFGAPWTTFSKWHNPDLFAFFKDPLTMFDTPFKVGAKRLLFGLPDPYPIGFFVLHPVLILSVWGFWYYFRARTLMVAAQIVMSLAWFTLYAKFRQFDGGSSGDPRYLMLFLGLMFIPVAFWLDRVPGRMKSAPWRAVFLLPFAFLAAAGFFVCFIHLAEYFGHDLDVKKNIAHFSLVSRSGISVILNRAFVSWRKLPWYFATLAGAGVLWAAGYASVAAWRRKRQ